MQRIVLDDETRSKLNGLRGHTEFCDPSGQPLGYFISPETYAILNEALERVKAADQSDLQATSAEAGGRALTAILADWQEDEYFAELDRRCREEETYTLEEIWKELGVQ